MTLPMQLIWGSTYLGLSCLLHVAILTVLVHMLERLGHINRNWHAVVRNVTVLLLCLLGVVLSHTLQVWIWAAALLGKDQLPDWSTSIYFALVSYTTLGYGDVILGPGSRLFGTFTAVTGMLAFGLSTAFLVAVMTRLLQLAGHGADKPDKR